MKILDARALNRATLARQLLLQRGDMAPLDAVAHLAGLQAQEPQEPFVGLWSRLRGFEPRQLDDLLTERRVVRTHMMRRTVHLVTADDALAWRTRHDSMLVQRVLTTYRVELAGVDVDAVAEAGREVMADGVPRTTAEIVDRVLERVPDAPRRPLGELLVPSLLPAVQMPPRGLWRTTAGVRHALLTDWLGRDLDTPDKAGEALVRRYLAAFGPAASADLRAWCGLSGMPAAVKAVRPELVTFRDTRGRELLDLPDAPRPDADTPAPVRFLPAFDNAILGYDDRTRIIDDAHRNLSVEGKRVVLVDGRVAATWTQSKDGEVTVAPLRPFSAGERDEVTEEARTLALFLGDGATDRVHWDA